MGRWARAAWAAAAAALLSGLAPPIAAGPALAPEAEQRTFVLEDGFRVELVASEPLVEDPVALAFDPEGRMWVVEMRGFMPTIDGKGEDAPIGRVVVLEDRDGDGRVDRRTVFLDGLVLPRALALVQGGALVAHGGQLWFAADRNGDLAADGQVLVDPDYAQKGESPAHQANGLLRALDNWIYNAKSTKRYRLHAGRWSQDRVEFRGQWGLSQDDWGRLVYHYNWDHLRADLVPPLVMGRNPHNPSTRGLNVQVLADQRVFPAGPTPGVNRGDRPYILDEQKRLRELTSAGAPLVYRGDAYPAAFAGNAFVCEPAGNLVKRDLMSDDGLTWKAAPAYDGKDFWTSTDERFRPVNARAGAPADRGGRGRRRGGALTSSGAPSTGTGRARYRGATMQLVACPACQRQISTEAAACPGCGHPQPHAAPASPAHLPAGARPGAPGPEEERWSGTPSVKALLGPIVRTGLFAILVPLVVYLAFRPALELARGLTSDVATWLARYEEGLRVAAIGFVVTVVGLCLLRLAWQILVLKAHRYRITTHRIGVESGVFSKRIEEIDMRMVEDLEFRQTFLDRLLRIGQITILSGDRSTGRFTLVGVARPREVRELIRQTAYAATKGQLFTRST